MSVAYRMADEAGLEAAAAVLNAGGVVVIPTDTVYGLAAHPAFPDAVSRLYAIKNRAARKPIALLAADVSSVTSFGVVMPDIARRLADAFWPGALTLVLPMSDDSGKMEGFRVPDHTWTRRLLASCGGVLRVTSANLSGNPATTDAEAALAEVGLSADLMIDDGPSRVGIASTVAKVSASGEVQILRVGGVDITRICGQK